MNKITELTQKRDALLHSQSTAQLCEIYERLNDDKRLESCDVQEAVIDELERRDPNALFRWLICDVPEWADLPSRFFIEPGSKEVAL